MEKVKDITSLPEYEAYKKAENALKNFQKERQQQEKKISTLFSKYRAALKSAEMDSNSFKEQQKAEEEAEALKDEAARLQQELEEWQAETPHYGNQFGAAKRELRAAAEPFIADLAEQAKGKLDDCRELLQAIQSSKSKFTPAAEKWIPSVTHRLEQLKSIKSEFK